MWAQTRLLENNMSLLQLDYHLKGDDVLMLCSQLLSVANRRSKKGLTKQENGDFFLTTLASQSEKNLIS